MRHADPQRHRVLFAVGVALLAANLPVGWLGVLACGALAAATCDPRWVWGGAAIYAFSWGLLGVGALITGTAGIAHVRELCRQHPRCRAILGLNWRHHEANAATRGVPPEPPRPTR